MKAINFGLAICLVLFVFVSRAQTNTFPTTGNVGIGTLSPSATLEIYRTYNIPQTKSLRLFFEGTWGFADYATNYRFLDIASSEGGKILQVSGYGIGIGYDPPIFESPDRLYISGNVGIGTTSPAAKLAVNGLIRAREVKVESAPWPDYVFAKGFVLPSLDKLEKDIKKNGHLPGIPSAKEVSTHGIKLGEMNAKLLQKMEELTLYLIAQEKKIIALQQQQKTMAEILKMKTITRRTTR